MTAMESQPGRNEHSTTGVMSSWTVVDAHGHALDLAFRRGRHLHESLAGTTDVPSLRAGGVTVQLTAMWIPDRRLTGPHSHTVDDPLVSALRMFDYLHTELDGPAAGSVILLRSAADIAQAKAQGKVALLIGMEGTDALSNDLAVLRTLYGLGLRHVGIVHERRNAYGTSALVWEGGNRRAYDAALDPPATLTEAGRELIAECDRLGILVDLTHLVDGAFDDALSASRDPVIVSHAGSRALRDTPRYLADAQVRAVASKGGVVCASPTPLGPSDEAPGLDLLLSTIDHFVRLVGADHVGIGTDFKDQFGYYPPPFTDSSRMAVVAEALFARGYRDMDVEKIMGGSVARVIRSVLG